MSELPEIKTSVSGEVCTITVSGVWLMGGPAPVTDEALTGIGYDSNKLLRLRAEQLSSWDTSLLAFLVRAVKLAREKSISVNSDDLPEGLRGLLDLAFAVPPKAGSERSSKKSNFFAGIGEVALKIPETARNFFEFLGDVVISVGRLFSGRADIRLKDVLDAMYESGAQALPIISLVSVLFGLILAFVGAVQLTQFGAQIYVAGLVGIGMFRVMGAIMVGVVMSGRTGAAYAAVIGAMQVNEEVDALSTFGLSPMDFLVLPRIIALTIMIPLLTVYADLMGMIGGFIVAVSMLGLSPAEFFSAMERMVPYKHIFIGLTHSFIFGIIIAISGCYQGIRCGRSAAAVGLATTAAVVNSIVGIIVATAIITVICNTIGI